MWEKQYLTDRYGFEKNIVTSGLYTVAHGAHLGSFFKPFTTLASETLIPNYHGVLLVNTNPNGRFGVSASGLNYFGPNTLFEGHVAGTGIPDNFDTFSEPNNTRSLGFRVPCTYVGWGFDVFGYPAPNFNRPWGTSGIYANSSQTPSTGFLASGFGSTFHGRNVPYPLWNAGPLDIRWDQHRGVWTPPQSVYSARIRNTYILGTGNHDPTGNYFSDQIRYDAIIADGIANSLMVTGAIPCGQRVSPDSYKVIPLRSGDFCFIVHDLDANGRPTYGVWIQELPGAADCDQSSASSLLFSGEDIGNEEIYEGASEGEPWQSSGLLLGSGLFDGLSVYNLPVRYGGTELNAISSGQIIIGNNSGTFNARTLTAGSGINLYGSGNSYIVGLSSHLNLLAGITFPLGLGYGGTGASGKVFVDLTTSQSIAGLKQFSSGIRIPSGSVSTPSLSFINGTQDGLYHVTTGVIGVSVSGIDHLRFTSTGSIFRNGVVIRNTSIDLMNSPPLSVYQHSLVISSGGPDLTQWNLANGSNVTSINNTGWLRFGPTGFSTTLGRVGVTGDVVCLLPTGNGVLALTSQITGGPVPTGLSDLNDVTLSALTSGEILIVASGGFINTHPARSYFPTNPYDGQLFYRTDLDELFVWDSGRGKWLGELDSFTCAIGSAVGSSQYFRLANGVMSSTVGLHVFDNITITRIVAGWGGTTASGTIQVRRDGVVVSSGVVKVQGELNAPDKNDSFTASGVFGVYLDWSGGTWTNPFCRVYYRKEAT